MARPKSNQRARVSLYVSQMKKVMDLVDSAHPTLAKATPCYLGGDHQNLLGALDCRECYPFLL